MIAAIQLLKEPLVREERRLVAEFCGPVGFEISINHRDEGMFHLFAEAQESSNKTVMLVQM